MTEHARSRRQQSHGALLPLAGHSGTASLEGKQGSAEAAEGWRVTAALRQLELFERLPAGYRDIGCRHWLLSLSGKFDKRGCELVRNHYSRRKPDSPQFMPPGETIVLVSRGGMAVWGWWRPHPRSGIPQMNGRDGWTCSVFARHGGPKASELVLDAEVALATLEHLGETAAPCGPDGMMTYVDPKRLRSCAHEYSRKIPGYCYRVAGYEEDGSCARKRKPLLVKPLQRPLYVPSLAGGDGV